MKKLILIIGIIIFSSPLLSQQVADSSNLNERNSIYSDYLTFKDTMTVNTWMNYRLLIQKLEEILELDNRIIFNTSPLKEQIIILENRNIELLDEINEVKKHNIALTNDINNLRSRNSGYIVFIIVFALLVIGAIIFFVLKKNIYMKSLIRQKYLEKENSGLYTDREKFEKWYEDEKRKSDDLEFELSDLESRFENAAAQLEELGKTLYKEKEERGKVEKELKRILGQLKDI